MEAATLIELDPEARFERGFARDWPELPSAKVTRTNDGQGGRGVVRQRLQRATCQRFANDREVTLGLLATSFQRSLQAQGGNEVSWRARPFDSFPWGTRSGHKHLCAKRLIVSLARPAGLEPATLGLEGKTGPCPTTSRTYAHYR